MALKDDYKDFISKTEDKKYEIRENVDGTHSLIDVTEYAQVGDNFGAGDINKITTTVNEVSKPVVYTLNEQRIKETWIDGKPLYRMTYDIGTVPAGGQRQIAINTLNIDTFFINTGKSQVVTNMNNQTFPLPAINTEANRNIDVLRTNNSLFIRCSASIAVVSGFVTIEYTKTTD